MAERFLATRLWRVPDSVHQKAALPISYTKYHASRLPMVLQLSMTEVRGSSHMLNKIVREAHGTTAEAFSPGQWCLTII
jgi:hypothetical protein